MRVEIDDGLVDAASKIWIATGWVIMVAATVSATVGILTLMPMLLE
jgi:hypothetical protein